ncbi:MAG TPA: cytochrome c [Candidatus Baltobacteraceae bacterium]
MRNFVLGVIACLVVILGGVFIAGALGLVPSNADAKPSALERWYARMALDAAIKRGESQQPNPVALTDENLLNGMHLYKENCAACHGGADGTPSNIAQGLYQRPPQLGKHGVEDDSAGETYWKVEHGIRLTGMPAFSKTLTDTQMWQITLFLQKMDNLPPAVRAAWQARTLSLF